MLFRSILIIGMEMGTEERDTAAKRGLPLEGMEKGLFLPAEMLEDAGFSHITGLDDLACTIEKGRILIEAPDEEDDAEVWDALRVNTMPGTSSSAHKIPDFSKKKRAAEPP